MKTGALKRSCANRRARAFSLFELFIVVAVVLILAVLFMPYHGGTRVRASRISCVNNLKQVGLAYRIWAGDHGDKFPMEVSITNGGTMEFVGGPETFRHFQVMSNELNTPRILFCPAETESARKPATTFDSTAKISASFIPFSNNSHLSYFVGLDATDTNALAFISGDRNITNGTPVKHGVLELTTNNLSGWTAEIHIKQGNVGLADGSVQMFSTGALRLAIGDTSFETNRLNMP